MLSHLLSSQHLHSVFVRVCNLPALCAQALEDGEMLLRHHGFVEHLLPLHWTQIEEACGQEVPPQRTPFLSTLGPLWIEHGNVFENWVVYLSSRDL